MNKFLNGFSEFFYTLKLWSEFMQSDCQWSVGDHWRQWTYYMCCQFRKNRFYRGLGGQK